MNAQEIFDTVAKHLAAQGCRSVTPDGESCLYRGPGGRMCAVGKLLRENEYKGSMEGCGVSMLGDDLPRRLRKHVELLDDLQSAHDDECAGSDLVEALRQAAAKRRLSPVILDTLTFPEAWA
jgi:hypothetical protein